LIETECRAEARWLSDREALFVEHGAIRAPQLDSPSPARSLLMVLRLYVR
jgi:hypothetical protein